MNTKTKTTNLLKIIEEVGLGSILLAEELKPMWERHEVTISFINNLNASGYTEMVENSHLEFEVRYAKVTEHVRNLCGRMKNVHTDFQIQMINKEAVCKNPSCQLVSQHRCSRCLMVSYCSLQCSHLCWQAHRQLCDRGAAARKVRKGKRSQRREQKARRTGEKVEEATIQEVD